MGEVTNKAEGRACGDVLKMRRCKTHTWFRKGLLVTRGGGEAPRRNDGGPSPGTSLQPCWRRMVPRPGTAAIDFGRDLPPVE